MSPQNYFDFTHKKILFTKSIYISNTSYINITTTFIYNWHLELISLNKTIVNP